MAEASRLADERARGNAHLIHEREEPAQSRIAPAAELFGGAQRIEPVAITHWCDRS